MDDNRAEVYDFDTNLYWKEIKAAHPPAKPVQTDLFAEEILSLTKDLLAMDNPDTDSPYADIDEIKALESKGVETFFSTDKFVAEEPQNNDLECQQFADTLAKIKDLNTTDIQQIKDGLKVFEKDTGMSLTEYLSDPRTSLSIAVDLVGNFEVYVQSSNVVASWLGRVAASAVTEVLGYFFAIYGPLKMLYDIAVLEEQTDEIWEQKGKLVALRQWARMLEDLAGDVLLHAKTFPSVLQFDHEWHGAVAPYYIARYYEEENANWGSHSVFYYAPDRMKKGFDEGWDLMEKAGNEMLSKVDFVFDDLLRNNGFDACKIKALRDSGLVSENNITAVVMREFARAVLKKLPKT